MAKQTTKGRLLPSSTSEMGRYTLQCASIYLWLFLSDGYDAAQLLLGSDQVRCMQCTLEEIFSAKLIPDNQHVRLLVSIRAYQLANRTFLSQ